MKAGFVKCFGIIFFIWIIMSGNAYSVFGEDQQPMEIIYDGATHTYTGAPITLELDHKLVQTGAMPPIIFQGNTLVPAREVFETMGAVVKWDGKTKQAYILMDDTFIVLQIDNKIALVNDQEVPMPIPAKLITNKSNNLSKTMIPFRFVAETLGFMVDWDNDTRTIIAMTPAKETEGNEAADDSEKEVGQNDENGTNLEETNPEESNQANPQEGLDSAGEVQNNTENTPEVGANWNSKVHGLPTPLKENPVVWGRKQEESEKVIQENSSEIVEEHHPEVNIEDVSVGVSQENLQQFIVTASGKISNVEYHTWNEKLIIDITNAEMKLKSTNQEVKDNPFVTDIRASQYEVSPSVTRIVFDLKQEGQAYHIYLSSNRKQIFVDMMQNTIHRIELGQNDFGDILYIEGNQLPYTKIFRLTDPDRIVIDMPYTVSQLGNQISDAEGQYVSEIATSQFTEDTMRIVLKVDGQADYQIVSVDDYTVGIQMIEPAYQNIQYNNGENIQFVLRKDNRYPIDLSKIAEHDDYMNKVYSITLPGDYSQVYGEGMIQIGDGAVESALIQKDTLGNSQIVIFEKSIYAYEITEDESYIYINVVKPRDKYNQIIVLDPGHGGSDPGARANGIIEKNLNLDLSLRVNEYLEKDPNIKVYITRTEDTYPTLEDRSVLANELEADIFVSIHNNATGSTKINGTETLYHPLGSTNSSELTSKKMARIFQDILTSKINSKNRGVISRPELYVLRHTTMPAVILEIGYMTNKQEAAHLSNIEYRQQVATAVYQGIKKVFEEYPTRR